MSTIPRACFSVHIRMGDPPPIFRYCSCIRGVRLLAMNGASLLSREERGKDNESGNSGRRRKAYPPYKTRKELLRTILTNLWAGRGIKSLSRKSRRRKSWTSSVVSGPPRFNKRIPVLGFACPCWSAPLLKPAAIGRGGLRTGQRRDERSALAALNANPRALITDEGDVEQ